MDNKPIYIVMLMNSTHPPTLFIDKYFDSELVALVYLAHKMRGKDIIRISSKQDRSIYADEMGDEYMIMKLYQPIEETLNYGN